MSDKVLKGSGGAGGGGSSSFTQRPDNLRSDDTFEGLMGLCIGPIKGPTDGLKSIKLDGTPIQNADGNMNFPGFVTNYSTGDPANWPEKVELKLGAAAAPTSVNVGLVNPPPGTGPGTYVTRSLANVAPDYIDLRFIVSQLYKQTKKGIFDNTANLEIQMKPTGTTKWINPILGAATPAADGGGFSTGGGTGGNMPYPWRRESLLVNTLVNETDFAQPVSSDGGATFSNSTFVITGKTTSPVVYELRIAVPTTGNYVNKTWDIRVRLREKDTVDADPNFEKRTISWESIAAVYTDTLGEEEDWKGVAWMQFYGKASNQLSGVPDVEVEADTKIVSVPPLTVFNPDTRAYTATIWDGSWAKAYTNDPSWVINDVISDELSGMSLLAPGSYLNKWDALEGSKWFSELVPDGAGGTHPRYSLNVVANQQMKAEDFVRYLAGAVGALVWDEGDGQWRMKVDKADNPVDLFTLENIDGEFVYSHTDVDTRYNNYTGTFLNEEFDYREDSVSIFDNDSIALIGHKPTSIALVGCTNRQEALRRLMVRQRSSVNETKMVSFSTNRRGRNVEHLDTILVADGHLGDQSKRTTGRTLSVTTNLLLNSGDLMDANWTAVNSGTRAVSATTFNGNSAFDFTDANGAAVAGFIRAVPNSIPADTATYNFSTFMKKTVGATTTSGFSALMTGGTTQTIVTNVDTNVGLATAGALVEDYGTFWRVSVDVANNGTNTGFSLRMSPATRAATGTAPPANQVAGTTGTATFTSPQVTLGSGVKPYTPTGASAASSITVRDTMRLELGVGYTMRFAYVNPVYSVDTTTQPTSADWKKPTVVATRGVVNNASQRGDVTTIYLDDALPSGLPDFLAVALEATSLPTIPRLYRVTNVVYDDDGERVSISAMEIDTGKWAAADAVSSIDTVFKDLRGAVPKPLLPPDNDMLKIVRSPADQGENINLVANWTRPAGANISGFKVTYTVNGGNERVLVEKTTIPTADIVNPPQGTYVFKVYTVNRMGQVSEPLIDTQVVDASTIAAAEIYYSGGTQTVESLRPAEAGANVTGTHTSLDTSNVNGVPSSTVTSTIATNTANIATNTSDISDILVDVDDLYDIYGDTASADASATAAAASATAAAASASASAASQSAASTAATNAASANTAAQAAKTAAETAQAGAVSSASAASGYATTALGYRNDAGTSATSAAGSATTASTQAGNASVSAGQAATSASGAATSASSAATSATTAANAGTAAVNTAASLIPDRPPSLEYWTQSVTGNPTSVASMAATGPAAAVSIVTDTDFGTSLETTATGPINQMAKGVVPIVAGRKYEIFSRIKYTNLGSDTLPVVFRLLASYMDSSYAGLGATAFHTGPSVTALNTIYTDTWIIDCDIVLAAQPTAVWLRPGVQHTDGSNTVMRTGILSIRDVTGREAAAGSASAAATSATTAAASQTAAANSASAANTSATNAATSAAGASTSASNAATSASQASTSESNAAGSASTASTQASNAATSASAAAGSASAASGSASTASTQASNAATSATAAAGSATSAATQAGNASTSAGQASTSASNALGSANAAASSATVASNAGTAALQTAASLLPDVPSNVAYWSNVVSGAPTAIADSTGTVGTGGTDFSVYLDTTAATNTMKGVVPVVAGRKYEYRLRAKVPSGAYPSTFRQSWSYLDGTYALLGSTQTNSTSVPDSSTVGDITVIVDCDVVLAAQPTAKWLRFGVLRATSGDTVRIGLTQVRDVTAREAAAGSASAAATSASTAATQASNAATSASAANTSATNAATSASGASTSASNANTSAGQASTSASNAAGSASTASTQATNAANSATSAANTEASLLPDQPTALTQWSTSNAGAPSSLGNHTGSIVSDTDFGSALETTSTNNWEKGIVPLIAGRKYELTANVKFTAGGSYPATWRIIYARLDSTYAVVGGTTIAVTSTTAALNTVDTLSVILDGTTLLAAQPTAKWFRPGIQRTTAGQTLRIGYFSIRDVTGREAAAGSASAAATSASSASTSATNAGISATSATTSANTATTQAGNASTSATSASTSAATATTQASLAQTSATLASSLARGGITPNPIFADWPVAGSNPTSWNTLSAFNSLVRTADTGIVEGSPYYAATGVLLNTDGGMFVQAPISPGWYVVEATVMLNSGTWPGAGVLVNEYESSGGSPINGVTKLTKDFSTSADIAGTTTSSGTGVLRRFSWLWQTGRSTAAIARLYMMTNYASFGTSRPAKNVSWYKLTMRPANNAEIETQTTLPSLSATVTTQAGTLTTLQGRSLAYRQLTTNSGTGNGSTAFISAQSESSWGAGAVSTVAVGAREFHVYNQSGSAWAKALSVTGGSVTVYGDLNVGGSVRIGSLRIPIALQSFGMTATDGDTVSFGTDLGNIPQILFDPSALPALTSGQSYDIQAQSLTSTGFSMRAKIITATSPTTQSQGPGTNVGGTPSWRMHKAVSDDSYTGKYTFTATGNAYGSGFTGEPGTARVTFDCYVRPVSTGVWTKIGSMSGMKNNAYNDTLYSITVTATMTFGNPIGLGADHEFGILMTEGNTITAFTSVTYPKATVGGTVTSVPQSVPFTVIPQNV